MNPGVLDGESVPLLWPEATVVCLGSGPSLTPSDVDACRGSARVICVNDAWRLAPWADCLYACDGSWWDHHQGVPEFQGLKYGLTVDVTRWPDVVKLRETGTIGLELVDRGAVRTGRNSGYQAINLAVHFGARRILLLGYDCQRTEGRAHFFGEHPAPLRQPSPYHLFLTTFASLVEPLADLGITILNCSRETALSCFPRAPLREALAAAVLA